MPDQEYFQLSLVGNRKASLVMSPTQVEISSVLADLAKLTPCGYILGVHQQYTTTKFMFQTYDRTWLEYYSMNGLVMSDPTVAWCFENTGTLRWSDLEDPAGVLKAAADHGMPYGAIYATVAGGSRTMAGFARADREFTDSEIDQLRKLVDIVHDATADQAKLSPSTIEQLKKMSIMVTHPGE
jgi:LuxR family transcriptional regulator